MSLHALANHMAAQGRNNDSMLVHMTPKEVGGLHALAAANGGQLTINPETGLPEAGFLQDLLPALIGFGLNTFLPGLGTAVGGAFGLGAAAGTGIAVGGLTALATGNLSKGVMAGFGAYGGAGLGESLVGAGVNAATNAGTAGYESILADKGFIPGTPEYGAAASELALGAQNSAKAASLAASPMDRLTAGFSATTQSPSTLLDFAKGNGQNLFAAAAPALAGLSEEDDTVTKMPSTGMITPFVMNRKALPRDESLSPSAQQKYLSYGVTPITPFKAAEGGEVQEFRMGGVSREYGDVDVAYEMPDIAAQKALMRAQRQQQQAALDPAFVAPSEGPPLSLAPPEGEMDLQVIVFGPDGQMYGSPGAARRAGVTNYTTEPPPNDGVGAPLPPAPPGGGGSFRREPWNTYGSSPGGVTGTDGFGDGMRGNGTTDPYTQQFLDKAKTYKNTMTGDSASAFDYLMGNTRPTAQTTGRTSGSNSRGTVRAPVGMQTPAAPANTGDIQDLANVVRGGGGNAGAGPSAGGGFPAGLAPAANTVAQALGDMGLNALSSAISKAAMSGAMSGSGAAAGSSTGPNSNATNSGMSNSGGWGSRDAGGGTSGGPSSGGSAAGASARGGMGFGGTGSGVGGDGGGGGGSRGDGGGGLGAGSGGGRYGAEGGYLTNGQFDQRYADGGVTGGGNIDLHVPISIGGGGGSQGGGGFGGGQYQPIGQSGGMGGGLGGLGSMLNGGSNGRGDFGPMTMDMPQGGMNRPDPDFLSKQIESLPGYQAMKKAQQDYENSDESKSFRKYAQRYEQALASQSGAFGGANAQAQQQQQATQPMLQATQGLGKQNQAFGGNMGGMRYGAFAEGGMTGMADGGLGSLGGYSDGGRLLRGPGDGVSDSIPATIGQHQPARLADGEFVVPARIVSELGNGSTEAGARQLYAMMDRIQKGRKKTVGKNKVAANTRSAKHLPA